jgi:hypothetical protein
MVVGGVVSAARMRRFHGGGFAHLLGEGFFPLEQTLLRTGFHSFFSSATMGPMPFCRQLSRSFSALLALALLGFGCDSLDQPPSSDTSCATNVAQIAVWDGFLQTVCGCGGTNGAIVNAKTSLSCTYRLGTTLYVYFHGPALWHQLVPVGSPAIPATSLYNPEEPLLNRVFPITLTATGTYSFQDQFMGAELFGTITVTP